MEVGKFTLKATTRHTLGWEELAILPIGDVQLGAEGCSEKALRQHIEDSLAAGGWFIGMGDYVDVASPSNRSRIVQAELYDSVQDALEAAAEDAVAKFLRLVKGTEGRWLGLLEGHHYWVFRDGSTSDTRIAEALKAPFLGDCANIIITHKATTSKTRSMRTVIWAAHGNGGGQRAAAPITKIETIRPGFDADVYLMGHMTKLAGARTQAVGPAEKGDGLIHRDVVLSGTGGWFQGYMYQSKQGAGRAGGSYVEQRNLHPVAIGGPIIHLRPRHTHNRDYVERRVET